MQITCNSHQSSPPKLIIDSDKECSPHEAGKSDSKSLRHEYSFLFNPVLLAHLALQARKINCNLDCSGKLAWIRKYPCNYIMLRRPLFGGRKQEKNLLQFQLVILFPEPPAKTIVPLEMKVNAEFNYWQKTKTLFRSCRVAI
jgi:hypothetical protein